MGAFDAALNTLYSDPNCSHAAQYTPAGTTETIPVRVTIEDRDEEAAFGETGGIARRAFLGVRLCEVACPAKGDSIFVCGVNYVVAAKPMIDRAKGNASLPVQEQCG